MGTSPRTEWDYSGIVAAAYDHFFGNEPFWDQRFFEARLRANGGRALELACGTGRLLVPLLRDGVDVEGLDTSADMLDILRRKARALQLAPVLYQCPMQAFDLPGRYRTVFVPAGSFCILVHDEEIRATLACCLAALEPGGELIIPMDTEEPVIREKHEWRLRRDVEVPSHQARVRIHERLGYDPGTALIDWVLRWEIERAGQEREAFEREHRLRHHRADDFAALLRSAGFEEVQARRGYTESESKDPDDDMIFTARRPQH